MKTNKLDHNIKEKFAKRTFEPSASAWERLSTQLDEQPKEKKRGWFFYIGAAASILLLVSIGIQLFSTSSVEELPKEEVVIKEVNKHVIESNKIKNEVPVQEALVKVESKSINQQNSKNSNPKKENFIKRKINKNSHIKKELIIIANNEVKKEEKNIASEVKDFDTSTKIESLKTPALKLNPNSRIKINSDDLLFAVTHSAQEVKSYYAKYNVNRQDVLRTIKSELKKSNLKVNPSIILAEVERTIDDDVFHNNFMKSLKRRVSDIATAIASRND